MKISHGNGGWHLVEDADLPALLYLRLRDVDGRPRVTELYLDGRGDRITPRALRSLPLAQVEALIAEGVDRRSGAGGPDLSRLAASYATVWTTYHGRSCETCSGPVRGFPGDKVATDGERAITDWVQLSWLAQYRGSGIRQSPMKQRRPNEVVVPELTLEPPEDGRLSEDFLRSVATAYEAALARRIPYAPALAELAGVSRRTVHRWVYTARKRGIMPAAAGPGRIV